MRKHLLDQLTTTVQRAFDEWAAKSGVLPIGVGECVVVSFRVEKPVRTRRSDSRKLLEMNVVDFFSVARLVQIGAPHALAVRAASCIETDWTWEDGQRKRAANTLTMREFLDAYSRQEMMRIPNLGKKSIAWVIRLMREDGLPLSDSRWFED